MFPDNYLELLPPDSHDVTWRYIDISATCDITRLIQRIEHEDNPPYRTSWQDVTHFFDDDTLWAAIGAYDQNNELRACGHVRKSQSTADEYICHGGVDPSCRGQGLGRASLIWQEAFARFLMEQAGRSGTICVYVEETDTEFIEHLDDLGFRQEKSFYELVYMFDNHMPRHYEVDPYISIIPWDRDYSEHTRKAVPYFTDHAVHWSSSEWEKICQHCRIDASFMVLYTRGDRPQVVGYILTNVYEQDYAVLGRRQASIEFLALDHEWLSVFPALITQVVDAYRAQDFQALGASIQVCDTCEDYTLYSNYGFRISSTSHQYVKAYVV